MTRNPYTAWTSRLLAEDGFDVWKVERREIRGRDAAGSPVHRTFDLYGIGDLMAIRGLQQLIVQSTGPNGAATHRRAILENPRLPALELLGFEVWLVWWTRPARRGIRKAGPWQPRLERMISPPSDLAQHEAQARALAVRLVQQEGGTIPFSGGTRHRAALAASIERSPAREIELEAQRRGLLDFAGD